MGQLVSVIIPTWNRAWCLARAIDSALGQVDARVEIIVVDDGSTDETGALLRDRYGGEPRVRPVWQANAGVIAARNHGLQLAQGDYVAFLDSDDAWKPWKLALQLACFRACPELGMVWTDMEAIGPDGECVAPRHLRSMYAAWRWFKDAELFPLRLPLDSPAFDTTHTTLDATVATAVARLVPAGEGPMRPVLQVGDVFSAMAMGSLVHTSTVLMTRERCQRVGLFDPALHPAGEDYDFHWRTAREGLVGFVDVASVEYQVGMPDRLTRHSQAMARNFLTVLTRRLAQDRKRIRLPAWMLRETLANAHGWMAETLVEGGDSAAARRHFLASLAHKPRQPRAAAQLALGLMPQALETGLRRQYHRYKAYSRERAARETA